ncbi:MAG TPA: conjugal transfer protein [Acidimicrobiales bacterium]|nr:conjugal transfer protein [Acidimicrobiales bacterium]
MRRGPATTAPVEPEVVPFARPGPAPAVLTRLATCALWALVVVGAIGGSSALLRPPARAAATAAPAPSTAGPSGFAELYVAAYLRAGQGTEAQLRAYYPERVELRDVPAGSRYPARTVTLAVEAVGERYWSVVVAAEVLLAAGDEFRRDALRYYRVAVVQPGPGQPMAATSLPAEVPAPPAPSALRLDVGALERPRSDDPVADALGRFFSAFLAGQGELARYVAPGADLVAVTPAPFAAVEVVRMATQELAGGARMVLAEVRGTDAGGRQQLLHYSLRLGQREQRWEVAELLPGPPLAAVRPPAGVATATTTTAPPGPAPTDPTTATTTEGMTK